MSTVVPRTRPVLASATLAQHLQELLDPESRPRRSSSDPRCEGHQLSFEPFQRSDAPFQVAQVDRGELATDVGDVVT
jgi:hypothetical protein